MGMDNNRTEGQQVTLEHISFSLGRDAVMTKMELAKKLAEMTRAMEEARELHNKTIRKIYHQTDPAGWDTLKKTISYQEPGQ